MLSSVTGWLTSVTGGWVSDMVVSSWSSVAHRLPVAVGCHPCGARRRGGCRATLVASPPIPPARPDGGTTMTIRLNPYLSFRSTARQAMALYQSVFGGEL